MRSFRHRGPEGRRASVLAADIDPMALAAIALNAAANGVAIATTAEDLLGRAKPEADVILVGDLFYERALADRVLAFIEEAAARRCAGAHRRPAAQLLSQGPLRGARRIPRSGDARSGGRPDQEDRGLALSRLAGRGAGRGRPIC